MNEMGGKRVQDYSNMNRHGVLIGTDITWAPGGILQAGVAGNHVLCGTDVILNSKSPWSVFARVRSNGFAIETYPIIWVFKTDQATGFELWYSNSGNYGPIAFGSTTNFTYQKTINRLGATPGADLINRDTCTLLVFDGINRTAGGSYKLYYQGVNMAIEGSFQPDGTANQNKIGEQANYTFDGRIDVVYVWNRQLSQQEATYLNSSPYAMFEQRPYWMDYVEEAVGLSIPVAMNHFRRRRI